MADSVTSCSGNAATVKVTIYSNTGAKTENGFEFITVQSP